MTDEPTTCEAPDCEEETISDGDGRFCEAHSWEYRKHGRILDNWEFMRRYAG